MKNKALYIIILILLFVAVYLFNSHQPKTFQWEPTYSAHDRNPFGTYVFEELLKKSWKNPYTHSYKTIRRLEYEGSLTNQNILLLSNYLDVGNDELDNMLEYAEKGHTIFIAAGSFSHTIEKKMEFYTMYGNWWYDRMAVQRNADTLKIDRKVKLCSPVFAEKEYKFPKMILSCYFDSIPENSRVLAVNDSLQPIAISCPVGKGNMIFCCSPMIFTNYGILSEDAEFIWGLLSYLEGAPLLRTEFYETGSDESQSPFRYLLKEPPLRWALYITLLTILIFMIFTAKRKQRVIPVIKDPENHLLKFIRSLSTLYLRKSDNNDILQKKYTLFGEQLQRKYGIDIINKPHDQELFERIAQKTGHPTNEIKSLFKNFEVIDSDFNLSDKMLIESVIKMDKILKS